MFILNSRKFVLISASVFLFHFIAIEVVAEDSVSQADKVMTAEQVSSDIALAKEAYERIHPGYTRYTDSNTLNAAWQSIIDIAQKKAGMTLGDMYLHIQKTLTLVRCDHTKANLPSVLADERDKQAIYLPFRWVWLENRAFVTTPDHNGMLSTAEEVLAIDGQAIGHMVAQVVPYIPYDGYTIWSRNSGIADSLEFKGGAIDHFGSLLWNVKPTAVITIKTPDGKIKSKTVQRINYQEWLALGSNNLTNRDFKDAVQFKRLGKSAAYIRIDTFVNYRDRVDPDDIYDPIFKMIKEEKRQTLIIDLRQNGGGSSDASQGLFANLISVPTKLKLDMRVKTLNLDGIREHLWTWDKRALKPNPMGFVENEDGTFSMKSIFTDELRAIKPAKYAFEGKVIALTSHNNSSGSTNLLANLQTSTGAVLVGEKTGGSAEGTTAGVLFTLTLPESNITVRIPFFQYRNNVQKYEKGMGVKPDIESTITADAYLSGEDPIFKKALELIEY